MFTTLAFCVSVCVVGTILYGSTRHHQLGTHLTVNICKCWTFSESRSFTWILWICFVASIKSVNEADYGEKMAGIWRIAMEWNCWKRKKTDPFKLFQLFCFCRCYFFFKIANLQVVFIQFTRLGPQGTSLRYFMVKCATKHHNQSTACIRWWAKQFIRHKINQLMK